MNGNEEFEMKIIVDDNLSINCKVQKEMTVEEFEAVIMRAKALSKASGFSGVAIVKKRSVKWWDDEEIEELKKDWEKMTDEELEEKFSRSILAIRVKATFLGLKKSRPYKRKVEVASGFWNDEEIRLLKELDAKGLSMLEISKEIGRSRKQCYDKRTNLKQTRRW